MAIFQLFFTTFLENYFNLELFSETLLVFFHLFHGHAESLSIFNLFTGRFSLISFSSFVKFILKAGIVCYQCLNLCISAISFILQVFRLQFDNLLLDMELCLEFEKLMVERDVVLRSTFLLALAEQFLSNSNGLVKVEPVYNLTH